MIVGVCVFSDCVLLPGGPHVERQCSKDPDTMPHYSGLVRGSSKNTGGAPN